MERKRNQEFYQTNQFENIKYTTEPETLQAFRKKPHIRRVSINKNITLFYPYLSTKKEVYLLTF